MFSLFNRTPLLFGLLLIIVCIGCTTRADVDSNLTDDREIFVRLINSTEYEIGTVSIGHQYIKPNSYSRTTYFTRFSSLKPSQTTQYKQIHNVTIGQRVMRLEDIDLEDGGEEFAYIVVQRGELFDQLGPDYFSEVKWQYPYGDEITTAQGLIEGRYTIELLQISDGRDGYGEANVKVTKDE